MTFSSFPGGVVKNETDAISLVKDLGLDYPELRFDENNFGLSFTFSEIFFQRDSEIPMEFEFRPADKRIWGWGFNKDWDEGLYSQIIKDAFPVPDTTQPPPPPPYIPPPPPHIPPWNPPPHNPPEWNPWNPPTNPPFNPPYYPNYPPPGGGDNVGLVLGIVCGFIFFCIIIIICAVCIAKNRRNNNSGTTNYASVPTEDPTSFTPNANPYASASPMADFSSTNRPLGPTQTNNHSASGLSYITTNDPRGQYIRTNNGNPMATNGYTMPGSNPTATNRPLGNNFALNTNPTPGGYGYAPAPTATLNPNVIRPNQAPVNPIPPTMTNPAATNVQVSNNV